MQREQMLATSCAFSNRFHLKGFFLTLKMLSCFRVRATAVEAAHSQVPYVLLGNEGRP